jgi:putative ABC transport system ATP-binding protein
VVANYAEADATKIAEGQPATITLSALSSTEVSGVVTAVSPTSSVVSNVVTYPVTVALTNPPSTVKEGMTAQVAVIVQTADNVLQLPSAAITTTGSISTVKVLSKGVQTVTSVTLGLVGSSYTEIASGLHEGQTVVEPTASVSASSSGSELDGRRRWWWVPQRWRLWWRGPVVASDARMGPNGSPARWPVIALSNIVKRYVMGGNDVYATRGVSLSVSRGEFVAIMGASGSGKSTLMNIIGCLDVPTSGHYRLDGVNIRDLDDRELSRIRNRKIGFVFQGFNLLPTMSAIANVELPMAYAGVPTKERRHRAEGALESVGLADRMGHFPNEMSGGQQQRVAVARAIATNPSLILADEPTGNLDSTSSVDVMSAFVSLHAQGRTVVMITHEEDIAAYATRVVRLRDGVITHDDHQTPAHPHESHLAHAHQAEGSRTLAGQL